VRSTRWRAALCAVALGVALAGLLAACGDDDDRLTVLAAASLTDVLQRIEPDARYSFAASDTLATQIREGAPADVYAAANERLPSELFEEGLVERPVVFATNRLVLLVPAGNPRNVRSVADLRAAGMRVVMAGEGVPAGDYTREVLANLGAEDLVERAVSQEDDVRGVSAKVALGEADAGFAYATDAAAVDADVDAVPLPAAAQPPIRYGVAVVAASDEPARARALIDALRSAEGRAALEDAGFGVP
jgi:molybdate transport system substrate-binding protein